MPCKGGVLLGVLTCCISLAFTCSAVATETVTLHASFNPDRLGAPTNLSATATFGPAMTGPLPPVTAVTTYGPAGMALDVRGAGTCTAGVKGLEALGPSACPVDSRVGFGKATGLEELAKELIPGPFTLEFFLAPREHGQLSMLIYASSFTPAVEQFVMVAREVHGPKPYGLGISFSVPIVEGLPGATLGWVERVLVTLGSAHVAYYRKVHGRRTLRHVRGLTVPGSCPRGGFPLEGLVTFADGNSTTTRTTIPCPHR